MEEGVGGEINSKRLVQFEQAIEPLTTNGEQTAVAAVGPINQFGGARDDGETAQKAEPQIEIRETANKTQIYLFPGGKHYAEICYRTRHP